jgi:outer membrane protein
MAFDNLSITISRRSDTLRKLLVTMILLFGLVPAAVAAEATNVGYVDLQYLIDNSPQAKAATQELEQQFGPQQEELRQKQQEFQQLQERMQKDGLVLSESEREEMEQRMRELKRDLQRGQEAFREELNIQRNNALSEVREAVLQAVRNLAEEEGYDLVVGQGVLHASDAVNLTERVLERMQERFDAAGSE